MRFFQPTPPSRRKLEKAIGWMILVLGVLAVPYTYGALQYWGLVLVVLLLIMLNHVIIAATARTDRAETRPGDAKP